MVYYNWICLAFQVQSERYNSHVVPEEGVHHCKFTGTCMLQYDTYIKYMQYNLFVTIVCNYTCNFCYYYMMMM